MPWFGIVLALLLGAASVEETAEERRASLVADAHARGDQEELAHLAAEPRPDPWHVVDLLRKQGRGAAARALAGAAPAELGTALSAFLGAAPGPGEASAVEGIAADLDAGSRERRRRELELARSSYQRACDAAHELGWLAAEADGRRGLGSVLRQGPGGLGPAVEEWGAAADLYLRVRNQRLAATCLYNRGSGCGELGRFEEALVAFGRARPLFAQAGEVEYEVRALRAMGLVRQRMGRPGEALPLLAEAERLAADLGGGLRAGVLLEFGEVYGRLGNFDAALDHARRALAAFEAAADLRGVADARGVLGMTHERRGAYEEALPHVLRSLELYEELGDSASIPIALTNVALLEMHLGRLADAEAHQRRALSLAGESGDVWLDASGHFHLSRILCRSERYDEARASDEHVIAVGRRLGSDRLLMRGELNAARRGLARSRFDEALAAARRAVDCASRVVTGLALEEDARARDHRSEVFDVAVRAALGAEDPEALLWAIESGRARSLLDSLGGEAGAERARGESRDIASLAQLEASLGAGEALVLYRLLDPSAVALVVTSAGARIVHLSAASQEIGRRFEVEQSNLGYPRGVPAIGSLKAKRAAVVADLRRRVVDPLGLPSTTERVLVCPDGALAYVPFALLAPELEFAYVPSGSIYRSLTVRGANAGRGVVALAGTVAADGDLPPLPGSHAEVRAVGDPAFVDAGTGELAAALGRKEPWRSVHLACHGIVQPDDPLGNQLVLAPSDRDDGRLTVLDVFGMSVRADLVVLSACETAVGRVYRAEGVFGFPRAFLAAGAPRVIASLWRVDDEATRALMVRLYELWNPSEGEGLPLASALREAQAHVRSTPGFEAPEFWAAWQLWGLPD